MTGTRHTRAESVIEQLDVSVYRVPTDFPKSDGTLAWNQTTIVIVGGFTSYSVEQLQAQLGDWVASGIPRVKMKVGREPAADVERVQAARASIGPTAELFVDANGAYSRKQALAFAEAFAGSGVNWFEEPVSSDDLEGLRLLCDRVPAGNGHRRRRVRV
jgi:L-alanine-DL-glutamate epimerase-like enolase superfamily enzyme